MQIGEAHRRLIAPAGLNLAIANGLKLPMAHLRSEPVASRRESRFRLPGRRESCPPVCTDNPADIVILPTCAVAIRPILAFAPCFIFDAAAGPGTGSSKDAGP